MGDGLVGPLGWTKEPAHHGASAAASGAGEFGEAARRAPFARGRATAHAERAHVTHCAVDRERVGVPSCEESLGVVCIAGLLGRLCCRVCWLVGLLDVLACWLVGCVGLLAC